MKASSCISERTNSSGKTQSSSLVASFARFSGIWLSRVDIVRLTNKNTVDCKRAEDSQSYVRGDNKNVLDLQTERTHSNVGGKTKKSGCENNNQSSSRHSFL